MKGSLLNKMPGTDAQKFANLRSLYAYMWAHPGKKLLFMGGELGQWREWTETQSLDWHLLDDALHSGVQKLVRDLNRVYSFRKSLWETDGEAEGFEWIDVDNRNENIVAFLRKSPKGGREMVCVGNFSALPRKGYRLPLPREGKYQLLVNTDAEVYAGSGEVVVETVETEKVESIGRQYSAVIDLPAFTTLWFEFVE
jgi:1,4-alpha-glucan branching enzyme